MLSEYWEKYLGYLLMFRSRHFAELEFSDMHVYAHHHARVSLTQNTTYHAVPSHTSPYNIITKRNFIAFPRCEKTHVGIMSPAAKPRVSAHAHLPRYKSSG